MRMGVESKDVGRHDNHETEPPSNAPAEASPTDILIWNFSLQGGEKNHLCCFKTTTLTPPTCSTRSILSTLEATRTPPMPPRPLFHNHPHGAVTGRAHGKGNPDNHTLTVSGF